jgi:small GTP-binding protein
VLPLAEGALLVYDVTDEDSFERAQSWYKELIHEIGKDSPIILAGNKSDIINKTVSKESADAFARSKGIEHVNTSAQNGQNVEYIFTTLAESK